MDEWIHREVHGWRGELMVRWVDKLLYGCMGGVVS